MKRTVKILFSLLFGSLFLYSCENCDNPTIALPTEADNEWLVYGPTKSPKFENEKGVLIESYKYRGLNVQNVPAEGTSLSDECIERLDTQAFAQVSDSTKRYPALYTYILKKSDDLDVRVAVDGRGDWAIDKENPTHKTIEINGYQYTDVYEIKSDSLRTSSVKKILFNKQFGFLQINFYDGQQLKLVK